MMTICARVFRRGVSRVTRVSINVSYSRIQSSSVGVYTNRPELTIGGATIREIFLFCFTLAVGEIKTDRPQLLLFACRGTVVLG